MPYETSSIPGQSAKPYWGAREQNIIDQYKKYVPPQYVEDRYEISKTGASSMLNARLMEYVHPQTLQRLDHEATEAIVCSQGIGADVEGSVVEAEERNLVQSSSNGASKTSYKHAVHGPMILQTCGGEGSTVMTDKSEIKALADKLGLTVAQVKRCFKLLLTSRSLKERGK